MLPAGEILEQSDATAWMAKYCLNMLEIALVLANHDSAYEDIALKFFEHFGAIASAMDELWDEEDGFFYDRLKRPDGTMMVVRARSMVGLLPVFASVRFPSSLWEALPNFRVRARWFMENAPQRGAFTKLFTHSESGQLVSMVDKPQFKRLLARMLDEQEFLSPFGLRSLSRFHLEHPLVLDLHGSQARLDYEPAESTTPQFGGNSNWRGPVWFPFNFLAIQSLRALHHGLGDDFTVELPTGSGRNVHLGAVADELERRLLRLFLPDAQGRRPTHGANPLFKPDSAWGDLPLFYEYFNGDTGEGLGASHQTGWTALCAAILAHRGR